MSTTITDVTELQAMKDDLTEDYVLGNNIDASATLGWNAGAGFLPIGFFGTPFSGTFDGARYTISDLWIRRNTADDIGLFSDTNGATIENVILTNPTIWGDNDVGAIIGDANSSAISNVTVTGITMLGWKRDVGGLIGDASSCTISECSTTGTITGQGGLADNRYGGLVGGCYQSTVSKCYSTVNVTNNEDYVGGLIGSSHANNIDDCYARGTVTGDRYIGGLIGYNFDSDGLPVTVNNCFSTGVVTGNTDVGGLVGASSYLDSSSVVINCFWDTTTSGQASSAEGTGKTTAQMKALATFTDVGWDIGGSGVNRNDGYPFLHWESGGAVPIWQIWQDPDVIGKRSWTIPDLKDYKGRTVKNARVRAFRVDTHTLVETKITDANGSATFTDLPNDVDVVFHAHWGG